MSDLETALYVVATPIGNFEDITARALRILTEVSLIAAEDTRHSAKLLRHFGVRTKMLAVHEHNEREQIPRLLALLGAGKSIALISDAGTPLLSDPGYHLVRAVRGANFKVIPIPGACAAVTALCAAGLPSDCFVFEGFPPPRHAARLVFLRERAQEPRTLIFYESPHRIIESLADMRQVFGPERKAVVARELTKKFETIRSGTLAELHDWISHDAQQRLGEFVVLVHGAERAAVCEIDDEAKRVLGILMADLPLKQAVKLAAEITGGSRNQLYRYAVAVQEASRTTSRRRRSKP